MNTATALGAWGHSVMSLGMVNKPAATETAAAVGMVHTAGATNTTHPTTDSATATATDPPHARIRAGGTSAASAASATKAAAEAAEAGILKRPRSDGAEAEQGTAPLPPDVSYFLTTFPFIGGSLASHVCSSIHMP